MTRKRRQAIETMEMTTGMRRFGVAINRWVLLLVSVVMISALGGCGGSTFNVQNPPPPPPSNISIAFQPPPATSLLIDATTPLTATVTNDSSNSGVTWTLTCPNTGNCGTLSALHTESGMPTVYTPPAVISGNSQSVSIVAFATADQNQNVVAPISIIAFGSDLQGNYVLQVQGFDINNQVNYQLAGQIMLDGSGGITAGEQTVNFFDSNPNVNALVTKTDTISGGSYFLGPDGRGTITINTGDLDIGGNGVESFTFIFLSNAQSQVAQFDFALPGTPTDQIPNTGVTASGTMDLQTWTSASPALSGGYAFVVSGTDLFGSGPTGVGGVLNIDSLNTISGTGSVVDQNLPGITSANQKVSGTVSNADSYGAVTLNLNVPTFPSTTAFQFAGYLVDDAHIKLIENDNTPGFGGIGSTAGLAIAQGTATGTFTSFNGTYVLGVPGEDLAVFVPNTATSINLFTAVDNGNGGGTLTNGFTDTFLQGAGEQVSGTFSANYTETPVGSGRARAFFSNVQPHPFGGFHAQYIFYQTGNGNPALVLASANNDQITPLFLGAGIAYPQSAVLSFSGDYGFSFTQQNGSENDGTGWMTAAGGAFSGNADSTAETPSDTVAGNHSFTGTFSTTGCFVGTLSNGCIGADFLSGIPFNGTPFPADVFMIDPAHGFFEEKDLVTLPSGQVTFGYYATRTLPVTPLSRAKQKSSSAIR